MQLHPASHRLLLPLTREAFWARALSLKQQVWVCLCLGLGLWLGLVLWLGFASWFALPWGSCISHLLAAGLQVAFFRSELCQLASPQAECKA